jgi:hypothetical protein
VTGRALLGVWLGALVALPRAAAAAPCGKPDLLDMIPPNGALAVPANATWAAYYASTAEYLGEQVIVVTPDGNRQAFPARFDMTEGRLSVTPPDLPAPGQYTVEWPVLRASGSAEPGTDGKATFTVDDRLDESPPTFEGVQKVSWDYQRDTDECTDEVTKRYVFDLDLGFASDDGGRDGLTLILFQTSGPAADAGSVPVHARALPKSAAAKVRIAVVPEDAIGRVCFAGLVRDMTGKISNGGDVEACVQTVPPPFFRGCAVAPTKEGKEGKERGWENLGVGLLLLIAARRGRGRRGPRR